MKTRLLSIVLGVVMFSAAGLVGAQAQYDMSDLARLRPGRTAAQNALWIENALSARFNSSKQVLM